MRLHHLEVTAFGPFADRAEVDFDALSAGGVFLLTGATGSGKTSVLDAVCFALYGQVPGDRAGARHLRSDHAAPGAAPTVVLTVSIRGRTFRFTRSPAWTRPKQRGTGETRVPAHVLVEERRGDDWAGLTNRLDDAGLLVADLLGMTAAQFTQVAMLPQGRFQAFLRASSADRHAVLQKLFRTDRFEQVERWLVDRRTAARRASDDAAHRVLETLHRLQEAGAAEVPKSWGEDLAAAAERGDVAAWSAETVAAAEAARQAAEAAEVDAERQLGEAQAALDEARRVGDLQARAEAAARELVALAGRADALADLRERLAAHRRVLPLSGLLERVTACRRTVDRTAEQWLSAARAAHGVVASEVGSRDVLGSLLQDAVAARAVAEAFRPRAQELARTRARQRDLVDRADALAATLTALEDDLSSLPSAVSTARADLAEARGAAARVPGLEQEVELVTGLVEASARLEVVLDSLRVARQDLAEATDTALRAKDAYLDVREARINGMAAELAGSLAVGCACPVCGSAAHPAPAHADSTGVGRAEEDAARRTHEDAAFVQQGLEVGVATLAAEEATLTRRLETVDRAGLAGRLDRAREELGAAADLAAELEPRGQALSALETRSEAAHAARERTAADLAALRHELRTNEATTASLAAALEELLGDAAPDLDTLIARRSEDCALLQRALECFTAYDEAQRAVTDAEAAVAEAAADAGFDDLDSAASAMLTTAEAEAAETELAAAEARRVAAEQVLDRPETRAAVAAPPPEVDVAVARQRLSADTARASAARRELATARADRLVALDRRLRARLDAWAPLRAEHALVAALAQLVEGKGPDNPVRIRLAAYVLSERLRQVVAAANERLSRMTAQRYCLEHTDDRGAGELRGGLSLLVRDDWNGVPRDPATLSGGETFVVSLALALGLADTVAHEAGGTEVDTLFIDEGFGSLDPDTLEDVMDTLDTLRDGGRVVGLVSHVPELRNRITTQLEVVKGRSGSTLRPTYTGG